MSVSLFGVNKLENSFLFDPVDHIYFEKNLHLIHKPFYFNLKDGKDI